MGRCLTHTKWYSVATPALCSEVTPSCAQWTICDARDEKDLADYKASVLP